MKRWYAAHVVMCFRFLESEQDVFPIYEDVLMILAESDEEARKQAAELGIQSEDATSKHDGRKAKLTFVGIRKVISCEFKKLPRNGSEATYSQFTVRTEDDLKRFANGDSVTVDYTE